MPYSLMYFVLNCKYLPIISLRGIDHLNSAEFSVLVRCSYSTRLLHCLAGLELLVPNLLLSDVKLFITCISPLPCFQEKGNLSEKNLYI